MKSEKHQIFNNWNYLPKAWYISIASSEIKLEEIKKVKIQNRELVLFRGKSGKVKALDSHCPHMGTHFAIGKVIGDHIQCRFHHWEFDGNGICKKIPALSNKDQPKRECSSANQDMVNQPPEREMMRIKNRVSSYATVEKYGFIWIFPDSVSNVDLIEVPDLKGQEIEFSVGKINYNNSHHHISMINGLDPQHLKTVHDLNIKMTIQETERNEGIEYILKGEIPKFNFIDRAMRFLFGPSYEFSMFYSLGSVASLTLLRNVAFESPFLKKKIHWPRLHMIFAYTPLDDGRCRTTPIYVTKKRNGLLGKLISFILLRLTSLAYLFLKSEDDEIYNNIKFRTDNFLQMDEPIVRYIKYVNQLEISAWSNLRSEKSASKESTIQSEMSL